MRMPAFVVLMVLTSAASSAAQGIITPPPAPTTVSLSGPRFGITTLSDEVIAQLQDAGINSNPVITQFGWQFEKQFYATGSGVAMLNEWVLLLGGLDQGTTIPSISWLVGARTANGSEFGVGPNLTPLGWSVAFAAGTTFRAGFMNIPVNVAVVPSRSGMRVSFLTGLSVRRP